MIDKFFASNKLGYGGHYPDLIGLTRIFSSGDSDHAPMGSGKSSPVRRLRGLDRGIAQDSLSRIDELSSP